MALSPKVKPRDPPPSLFLHPSPGASHVSLPGILASGGAGLKREDSTHESIKSIRLGSSGFSDAHKAGRTLRTAGSGRSVDRTDALWAEMQSTLEEVELSATSGTHVFGSEHDRKLTELRKAQIGLAQAWARSEADSTLEGSIPENTQLSGDDIGIAKNTLTEVPSKILPVDMDAGKTTGPTGTSRPTSSGEDVEQLGLKLEEQTEADILLARKRRDANDLYFKRVNSGVLDVVNKLEDVAAAMRAVEQESKDAWVEDANKKVE